MRKRTILIALILMIGLGMVAVNTLILKSASVLATEKSYRPSYCVDGDCVPKSVFAELPEYPSNFNDVWSLMYPNPYLGILENFSIKYPDENYWKQPEFYAESFKTEWIKYYLSTNSVRNRCCSGPYPGDQGIEVEANYTYPIITFWHSGPAVWKYQSLSLKPSFPSEGKVIGKVGGFFEQDPERAGGCFDIEIEPRNILIEPTYPVIKYGWAQKVIAYITPKCSGEWYVTLSPTEPDASFRADLIYRYGLNMVSTMTTGGLWNIYINVE